jgi:hypothetical protein
VDIDGPRRRDNPGMIALRSRLLVELGVVEVPEDIPVQLAEPVTPA